MNGSVSSGSAATVAAVPGEGGINCHEPGPRSGRLPGSVPISRLLFAIVAIAARAELTRLLGLLPTRCAPRQTAAVGSSRLTTRSRDPMDFQEWNLRLDRNGSIRPLRGADGCESRTKSLK